MLCTRTWRLCAPCCRRSAHDRASWIRRVCTMGCCSSNTSGGGSNAPSAADQQETKKATPPPRANGAVNTSGKSHSSAGEVALTVSDSLDDVRCAPTHTDPHGEPCAVAWPRLCTCASYAALTTCAWHVGSVSRSCGACRLIDVAATSHATTKSSARLGVATTAQSTAVSTCAHRRLWPSRWRPSGR